VRQEDVVASGAGHHAVWDRERGQDALARLAAARGVGAMHRNFMAGVLLETHAADWPFLRLDDMRRMDHATDRSDRGRWAQVCWED
jgi:hypothetical protein